MFSSVRFPYTISAQGISAQDVSKVRISSLGVSHFTLVVCRIPHHERVRIDKEDSIELRQLPNAQFAVRRQLPRAHMAGLQSVRQRLNWQQDASCQSQLLLPLGTDGW